jgi:8-oxo-dGTP pyrophosphatase MutT (NUDIX family)
MSTGAITREMRSHFEAAAKVRVGDTALVRPALRPDEESLRAHFRSEVGLAQTALENPHVEPRIDQAKHAEAVAASVLIAVVLRNPEPTVLVTQRHHGISYPGHWVFPGGRSDATDATPLETAIREAEEEIGLDPTHVEVLGRLGDYYSHSGFRISPAVALVSPPFELTAHPGEVEAIEEIKLSHFLDSSNYLLYRFPNRADRAHFALDVEQMDIMLTGVTASIAIGLYTELLKTHAQR